MKKVLVTGAKGQLGRCLQDIVRQENPAGFQFLFLDRASMDIADREKVETFFFSNPVDYVINCAAYTRVDDAEKEAEAAFATNADGVGNLAHECQLQNATLIHISTDYVFDGNALTPYTPEDHPNPINVYGKSKLEGERRALEENPKTFVIRTSWLYSEYGKNFYTTMLRLMKEREEIGVVDDQTGKPTHAADLAEYIVGLITSGNEDYGIKHFAGPEVMTWFGFAKKIAETNGFHIKINPIATKEFPTPARRPKWSVLEQVL